MKTTTTTPATSTGPDTSKWTPTGRNVRFTTIDGLLFIAVDIREQTIANSKASASGKSKSIGSTEGNVAIPGSPVKMGVNVYAPLSG